MVALRGVTWRDGMRRGVTYLLHVEGELDLRHVLAKIALQRRDVDRVSYWARHFDDIYVYIPACLGPNYKFMSSS